MCFSIIERGSPLGILYGDGLAVRLGHKLGFWDVIEGGVYYREEVKVMQV